MHPREFAITYNSCRDAAIELIRAAGLVGIDCKLSHHDLSLDYSTGRGQYNATFLYLKDGSHVTVNVGYSNIRQSFKDWKATDIKVSHRGSVKLETKTTAATPSRIGPITA